MRLPRLRQEQLQQFVEEAVTEGGRPDHVRLSFQQAARYGLPQRLLQLLQTQAGALLQQRWREALCQPQRIHHEFEAELFTQGQRVTWSDARLTKRDGRPLWRVTVPANSSRTLRYRLEPED